MKEMNRVENAESKGGEASSGLCNKTSEQNTQPAEAPKQDYIHVRARRGQATDSHSLVERARRERISERMKILQDLVPGCNKVIGKASVLDEIINYIQALQRQVEFLSMKLEAVDPQTNSGIEGFPQKDLLDLLDWYGHLQKQETLDSFCWLLVLFCVDMFISIGCSIFWGLLSGIRYSVEYIKAQRARVLLAQTWKWCTMVVKSFALLSIWVTIALLVGFPCSWEEII